MKKVPKKVWAAILVLSLVLIGVLSLSPARSRVSLYLERGSIEQAVQRYFACEMNRDFENLYNCLAPSSVYRQSHSYQDFLADVENSPVKVLEYTVVGIYNLRANHDSQTYPGIDKFVQAEVEVILYYTDTNQKAHCNQCFTFIKEGGMWLKG